jgi:integrase
MLLEAAPYGGYIFAGTPSMLDTAFRRFCDVAELPRIRFHDLRHSFGQFMYDSGVDIKTLKDVLGHSNVAVTDRLYVRPSLAAQRCLLDLL